MTKKPIFKLFTLPSSQLALEWESLFGDKYRDATEFTLVETYSPTDADAIVWDGILNPKSQEVIDHLRPVLDRGVPLILTGERRAFIEDSEIAELAPSPGWKTIPLPPWGSLPEDLLVALTQCLKGNPNV